MQAPEIRRASENYWQKIYLVPRLALKHGPWPANLFLAGRAAMIGEPRVFELPPYTPGRAAGDSPGLPGDSSLFRGHRLPGWTGTPPKAISRQPEPDDLKKPCSQPKNSSCSMAGKRFGMS